MPNGWIVTAAVLLPNLIWFLLPSPEKQPVIGMTPDNTKFKRLEMVERVGQISSFVLPLFYQFHLTSLADQVSLMILLAALGLYYICWLRYFLFGRRKVLLYESLLGLPLPMTILPVIYFFAAAVNLHAFLLGVAAAVLAAGHIPMGIRERRLYAP